MLTPSAHPGLAGDGKTAAAARSAMARRAQPRRCASSSIRRTFRYLGIATNPEDGPRFHGRPSTRVQQSVSRFACQNGGTILCNFKKIKRTIHQILTNNEDK